MVRFFNLESELSVLEDLYRAPSSSLVVLYGRRRVGKMELAQGFTKDRTYAVEPKTISGKYFTV